MEEDAFDDGQIWLVSSVRHVRNLGTFGSEVVYQEATNIEVTVELRHTNDFVQ